MKRSIEGVYVNLNPPVNKLPKQTTLDSFFGITINNTRKNTIMTSGQNNFQIAGSSNMAVNNQEAGVLRNYRPATATVCMEIYQKLRAIFPDLRKDYILSFCPPTWANGVNHDVQFSAIVDDLLANEEFWLYEEKKIENQATTSNATTILSVDKTADYLAEIFPNADPQYLRNSAECFIDQNDVKKFVELQLVTPNYPTREKYLEKLKLTQEQERYTINFRVEDFIKLFPDPFAYFQDRSRKCEYNIVAFEFLKAFYNRIRLAPIRDAYVRHQYNLSCTARALNNRKGFMKSVRLSEEMPTDNIPLLQEMAFIRHQHEIRQYVKSIRRIDNVEFRKLKAINGLISCQCCYDDQCMPSKCSTCDNGHNFCHSCIIKGTDTKLGDGETHVLCFLMCGGEFSLSTLQSIIAPTTFSILLKKRQAADIMAAGLEGLVSCPFCHFASIPAEGDKVFKCFNPECMKETCIKCKQLNHVPLRCNEVEIEDKARKYIEEKMTQALARTCYKCNKSFFKEEGCNKITCPCGANMCFICDKPILDYHHFRGQGCDDMTKYVHFY